MNTYNRNEKSNVKVIVFTSNFTNCINHCDQFETIVHQGWPYIMAYTLCDVQPNAELMADYSEEFVFFFFYINLLFWH